MPASFREDQLWLSRLKWHNGSRKGRQYSSRAFLLEAEALVPGSSLTELEQNAATTGAQATSMSVEGWQESTYADC